MNKFTQKQEQQAEKTIKAICDYSQEFGELVNYLDTHLDKLWLAESNGYKTINIAPLPITAVREREFVINLNYQSIKYYNLAKNKITKRSKKLFIDAEDKPITIDRLLSGLKELYPKTSNFGKIVEMYSSIYQDIKFSKGEFEIIPDTGKALPAFFHTPIPDETYKQDHFRDSKRLANIVLMPSLIHTDVIYMFTLTTPLGTDPRFYEHSCDHFISEEQCKIKNSTK